MSTQIPDQKMLETVLKKALQDAETTEACIGIYNIAPEGSNVKVEAKKKTFEIIDHLNFISNAVRPHAGYVLKDKDLSKKEAENLLAQLIFADSFEKCISVWLRASRKSFIEKQAEKKALLFVKEASFFDDCFEMYKESPIGSNIESEALKKCYSFCK